MSGCTLCGEPVVTPKSNRRPTTRCHTHRKGYWQPCSVCGTIKRCDQDQMRRTITCLECRRQRRPNPAQCIDCGLPSKGERCRSCYTGALGQPDSSVHRPRRAYVCEQCGIRFNRRQRKQSEPPKYCTFDCYLIAIDANPSSPVTFRKCDWCEKWFRTTRGTIFCTAECRLSSTIGAAARRITDLYSEACKLGFGGANWRKHLVAALRERDGDLCILCWTPIDFTLKSGPSGSDQGYSIEHLIPRSQSHDDTWDNLALSHWGCNRNRRTNPIDTLRRA